MEHTLLNGVAMTEPSVRSRRRDRKQAGFTLIEILVVLGIIAVMAAVALPNITGYFRSVRVRKAQDQVVAALQKARARAISLNTQWGVTFVIQNQNVFWVHTEDPQAATSGQAAQTGRQSLNSATWDNNVTSRYELEPMVSFAIAAGSCPVGAAGGNQASIRFDRYGARAFPGYAPPAPQPAVPALGLAGATTTANGILMIDSNTDATICIVDQQTNLYRLVTIGSGGRIKKG